MGDGRTRERRIIMSITTQEEFIAIMALAVKAKRANGALYKTEEQYDIVMKWGNKWMEAQKRSRTAARQWNKDNPERHEASNKRWYAGFKERMKNDPEFREEQRAKRREYYRTVIKPRRQAQKRKK